MGDIEQEVLSPCVEHCRLGDEGLCIGCHRYIDEIVAWKGATIEEKRVILEKIKLRKPVQPSL